MHNKNGPPWTGYDVNFDLPLSKLASMHALKPAKFVRTRRVSVQLRRCNIEITMASDDLDGEVNKEEDVLEEACVYLLEGCMLS